MERPTWLSRRMKLLLALVLLLLIAHGCGAGYYLHLARGQLRMVWEAESVDDLLAAGDTPEALKRKLRLIRDVKRFGDERLGMTAADVYERVYDTHGGPVAYNLSACRKTAFEPVGWSFPIVGAVPYKGFFDLERARKEHAALVDEGYDVLLRGVTAYSTLGWFDDPINTAMLDVPDADLADLVLHEMTHATVWVPGGVPFNESLATYVGRTGAMAYLKAIWGPDSEPVRRARWARADAERFLAFMTEVLERFQTLYASDLSAEEKLRRREELWEKEKDRFRAMRDAFHTDRYDGFLTWELNNARLMSYRRYHLELELFERVREQAGSLKAAILLFRRSAEADDPKAFLEACARGETP